VSTRPGLKRFAGQRLVAGIRPEDLSVATGDQTKATLNCDVELVEALGSNCGSLPNGRENRKRRRAAERQRRRGVDLDDGSASRIVWRESILATLFERGANVARVFVRSSGVLRPEFGLGDLE